jgi:hypothetical protein
LSPCIPSSKQGGGATVLREQSDIGTIETGTPTSFSEHKQQEKQLRCILSSHSLL